MSEPKNLKPQQIRELAVAVRERFFADSAYGEDEIRSELQKVVEELFGDQLTPAQDDALYGEIYGYSSGATDYGYRNLAGSTIAEDFMRRPYFEG